MKSVIWLILTFSNFRFGAYSRNYEKMLIGGVHYMLVLFLFVMRGEALPIAGKEEE